MENDKKKYCACHTKRLSARYQTGCNVTKCRAWPRKTTLQPALAPSKRKGFAASSIDTARPQENQRLETRHVGASKRAFCARHPPIFTLCGFKIDVFLRVFLGTSKFATLKSMFCVRLPSIFTTSHKMPRLPRNLHLVATWRSPDNAIRKNTQHDTTEVKCCHCHAKWRWTRPKCCALPRKLQLILRKRRKRIAPATRNDFRHVTKHVWMSRSATTAARNQATRSLKLQKWSLLQYGPHADGCGRSGERLRTVGQRRANTPSTPRPPEWNGNPCYAFGKKGFKNKYLLDAKIAISLYPHSAAPIKHWSIVPNNLKTMTMQYAKPQKKHRKNHRKTTWRHLAAIKGRRDALLGPLLYAF